MDRKLLALVAFVVIAAGCIQPVVKLGCCRKECALEGGYGCKIQASGKLLVCGESDTGCEKGCFLYNTTDFKDYNYASYTKGQCDKESTGENVVDTQGLCNVSVAVGSARQDFLVPICGEADIVKCIEGNCTAMVCGDFVFKPRVSPGFSNTADADPEEGVKDTASGAVPADSDEGAPMQFYKAQCRFLPMDAKLRNIMKNSKSQINVFRMGVGGSFEEFDQYRYYFPISDKYCNANQATTPGQILVDRYMNYLTTDAQGRSVAYNDPANSITSNCVNGANDPAVLAFHEKNAVNSSTLPSPGLTEKYTYNVLMPDANNYKFAHHATVSIFPKLNLIDYGWEYTVPFLRAYYTDDDAHRKVEVTKKIDDGYYRKELSIAHAKTIYDLEGKGTTRATFECDYEGNDCYSGSCSTQKYSRSVMLKYVGGDNPLSAPEVVTDCNAYTDEAGMKKVVCAPTKSVTVQAGKPPIRSYGRVTITPVLFQYNADGNFKDAPVGAGDLSDKNALDDYWTNFASYSYALEGTKGMTGIPRTITNGALVEWNPMIKKKDCTWETYGPGVGNDSWVWCDFVNESSSGPPLGGITFFGKMGDDTVVYNGKTVIGWSNLLPGDFTQTLFYKNCGLTSADYEVVTLYSANDAKMPALLAAFKPYFQARVQGLKGGIASSNPNVVNKYSLVYSSMPWVPAFQRGARRVKHESGGKDCPECSPIWEPYRYFLSSPSLQALRARNIYDEDMIGTPGTGASSLVAADGRWNGNERDDDGKHKWVYATYNLGLSRYTILIYYSGLQKLGNCAIDGNTYLPRMRTFGWCEPCTTSTLAFQNVTSYNVPPAYATSECKTLNDEFGDTRLVCQKKEMLTPSTAPDKVYARVEAVPYHLEVYSISNPLIKRGEASGSVPASIWDAGTVAMFNTTKGKSGKIVNSTSNVTFGYVQRKYCTGDYGENNDNTLVLCSLLNKSEKLPPVGGAVFFGKTEKSGASPRTNVLYEGHTIIGYALATPGDFNDLAIVKACQLTTDDYVEVELTEPGDASWNGLTAAFRPYFQQRMEKVATGYYSGCNAPASKIQLYDLVFSSMPWVTNYDKGTVMVLPSWVGYLTFFPIKAGHLSSTAGQAFRTNAMWAGTVGLKGTDTCSLSSSSITGLPDMGRIYYNLAFSRYVYLFKYAPGSGKLGTCKVDDKTYIPQQQKFCKESAYGYGSCTEYDETTVSAAGSLGRSVYMPYYTANVEGPRYKSQSYICSGVGNEGTIACSNTGITDVAEYSGVATTTGAPRTFPEASTLKERIGNYLKSGVMPVIDLSSGSNWGRINPAGDLLDSHGTPWFLRNSSTRLYTEYDFERLFGEMGALLVIVEHVDGPSDADSKLETIIDRSGIVRDKCLTCLTAVHVDGPASNTTFGQTVAAMMSDPRANLNVDMVTFDYTVSRHPPPATAIGLQNKSIAVAEDIASYGSASLEAGGKPTMVVGLNVYDNDTLWNTDYGILFETIVGKQGLLVQAGVSGIIYSPARSVKLGPKPAPSGNPWYDAFINSIYNTLEPQSGKGVVAAPLETQVGVKTQKFCALQGALQKMSASPPVAVFSRLAPKDVECIPCTSIDYANGFCSLTGPTVQRRCTDGTQCTLPSGLSASQAKCPEEAVTQGCPMCSASASAYECTYTYINGTTQVITGKVKDLQSDAYSDVIAGLPEPYRCCIGEAEAKYSFTKKSYATPINKPVVFPRIGGEDVDCGMGGDELEDLSGLGGFCGYNLPLKMYDIACRITG